MDNIPLNVFVLPWFKFRLSRPALVVFQFIQFSYLCHMSDKNMSKTALHYGSLSGIAVVGFYMLLYLAGLNLFGPVSILGIWIPILFIVLATRYYRDHNLGGTMTYGQGLAIGFMTTIFSVILFGLFFYLFGTVTDNTLLDSYKTQAAESLEQGKTLLSDKMLDKAMESIDIMTMPSLALSEAFNKLFSGIIITLITAAVFRRKPHPTENI